MSPIPGSSSSSWWGWACLASRQITLVPKGAQNVFELIIGGLEEFMVEITGEEGRAFFPFIATFFLFIMFCNLIGLLPGFLSPTANINTTLSLALCTFVYTHYLGIKYHGAKYIKHFLGPIPALAPLFFPIEIIGHFARVLSLTLRLFGNIMGEDLVLAILLFLAGHVPGPPAHDVPGGVHQRRAGLCLHPAVHDVLCRVHGARALITM